MKQKKKLLIIGSNSFIGKNLQKNKKINNYKIFLLSKSRNQIKSNFIFYKINLKNSKETVNLIKRINPNYIIHLADTKIKDNKNKKKKEQVDNINLIFAQNIIKASRQLENLEKIIYVGSCDEYGNNHKTVNEKMVEKPTNFYGKYKLLVTKKFLDAYKIYKLPVTIIRPSVIYGPGQENSMLIPTMIKAYREKKTLHINSGSQYRDFLYIDDLVEGLFKIIRIDSKKIIGNIFNFSYGKSYKIEKIVTVFKKLIKDKFNYTLDVENNLNYKEKIQYYFISNAKTKKILKWTPKINVKNGLISTLLNEK